MHPIVNLDQLDYDTPDRPAAFVVVAMRSIATAQHAAAVGLELLHVLELRVAVDPAAP